MILESIFTFAIRLRVITAAFYNGNKNQLKLCDDFAVVFSERTVYGNFSSTASLRLAGCFQCVLLIYIYSYILFVARSRCYAVNQNKASLLDMESHRIIFLSYTFDFKPEILWQLFA